MSNKSALLLYEGLLEIYELAYEAKTKKPLLYEGTGYSPLQIVLQEAEGDKENFLARTTSAVKKITAAGKSGLKELTALHNSLKATTPPMSNSAIAASKAIQKLEKSMPSSGFLGKISTLGSAIFGDEDDPIEAITEIVADAAAFQTMMANIVKAILEMLDEINVEEVVDNAVADEEEEEGTAPVDDAQKDEYIKSIKEKVLAGTIDDILNSDDEIYVAVREATGFSVGTIKKAIKTSTKPAKWFTGLRSLGGALGIGLGGELPFSKFGLKLAGLEEDITLVKISSLKELASAVALDKKDTAVIKTTTAAIGDLADIKNDQQNQAPSTDDASDVTGSDTPGEESTIDSPTADTPEQAEDENKYLKIVKTIPDLNDPEGAATKLASLLAADVSFSRASLLDILSEKVLRYNDVVASMKDHLPEDEAEIPGIIKKLADEVKIELGAEFDIVGIPSTSEQLEKLRAELAALRDEIKSAPEEDREALESELSSRLEDDGLDSGVAEDLIDTSVDLDSAIEDSTTDLDPDEKDDQLTQMLKFVQDLKTSYDKIHSSVVDESEPESEEEAPQPGAVRDEDQPKTLKDRLNPTKLSPHKADKTKAKISRDPGTHWKVSDEALAKDSKKRPWAAKGKGPKSKKQQRFKSEKSAKKYSLKTERVVLANMRAYILGETNNFRKVSNMLPHEVIIEYYKLGGTNDRIKQVLTESSFDSSRLGFLAGITNE
jgi:hypothetical protein